MRFVDPGGHAGDELLAAVAASLSIRLAEITQDVTEHLAAAIEQLRGDTAILGVLRASVTENITAILHVFEHGMPVDTIEAPPAAIEYARRLAQRGVPAGALIRAYRVGHERFLQWCLDELPLHACGVANFLGVSKVLDPPYSSVFSALGAGNTPQLHIHERTCTGTGHRSGRLLRYLASISGVSSATSVINRGPAASGCAARVSAMASKVHLWVASLKSEPAR